MVSAFNHRPSRAALRKLLAQLLLSGLFVSAVFAGVPRSQGIQPSPTIRAESNAATHTLAVNIPVSEENNIPNTTVSPRSCLFALLALAMLGVSQPSARFLANGSKDSRSLRISPIICILDSILLIDLFASLLWLGKGVREVAQCIAAFRYCEQDTGKTIHLQTATACANRGNRSSSAATVITQTNIEWRGPADTNMVNRTRSRKQHLASTFACNSSSLAVHQALRDGRSSGRNCNRSSLRAILVA